jgi:hypothetical protein
MISKIRLYWLRWKPRPALAPFTMYKHVVRVGSVDPSENRSMATKASYSRARQNLEDLTHWVKKDASST